jgi:myo-inositol 2-dehydrogenase/D-chiro-inositol 1-dehydrogenase
MTGFNRRFDPNFAALRARIAAGDIGAVELATITSRDPAPPPVSYIERSGGLFRDMMIHDFDMARFLLGEEFVRLHAVGSALVDPAIGAAGDVDTAAVILTTASGRICQISNSRRAAYGYDQRIEVHGEKGHAARREPAGDNRGTGHRRRASPRPGAALLPRTLRGSVSRRDARFVEAATGGTRPEPGIHDGLQAQILADAATRSRETAMPVDLL